MAEGVLVCFAPVSWGGGAGKMVMDWSRALARPWDLFWRYFPLAMTLAYLAMGLRELPVLWVYDDNDSWPDRWGSPACTPSSPPSGWPCCGIACAGDSVGDEPPVRSDTCGPSCRERLRGLKKW